MSAFESVARAQEAVRGLRDAGFDDNAMSIVSGDQPRTAERDSHSLLGDMGVPVPDAHSYLHTTERGGAIVLVQVDDARRAAAVAVLERFVPIDVHADVEAGDRHAEVVVPVLEERLAVGKRDVERGGVRVYTRVVEAPVREQVALREEHVTVEGRAVDRPAAAGDEAFRERTIEVRQTAEEVVVEKQARVVEEVVITKDVGVRTEVVHATLHKTTVAVEQLEGARGGYESYEPGFESHYGKTLAQSGVTYAQCTPAYRYGYALARDTSLAKQRWQDVERDAKAGWEAQQLGTWERFAPAVRRGWEAVIGAGDNSSKQQHHA